VTIHDRQIGPKHRTDLLSSHGVTAGVADPSGLSQSNHY
jgi:hypothetical protein